MTEQPPQQPKPANRNGAVVGLAALALLALVAVFGSIGTKHDDTPALAVDTSAATPETSPLAEPTPEDTPPTFTAAELDYLADIHKAGEDEDEYVTDAWLVSQGHELCGQAEDEDGDAYPPDVDAILENSGDNYKAAIKHLCPEYLPVWKQAEGGFSEGTYTVGKDIKPGTYRTYTAPGGRVTDCYWERSTGGGQTIANDFVKNAPKGVTVTLRRGEGFTSEGCGNWIPVR